MVGRVDRSKIERRFQERQLVAAIADRSVLVVDLQIGSSHNDELLVEGIRILRLQAAVVTALVWVLLNEQLDKEEHVVS